MHTPSLPTRNFLLAALPLLLLLTACRRDPNGYTDVQGWVIDRYTGDSLANIAVNLVQCDENNERCYIRKTTKTDARGYFRIMFQGREKRQFRVEMQGNDSIHPATDPRYVRAGYSSGPKDIFVTRSFYATVRLVIRKNDAPHLMIGNRQLRNGAMDTVLRIAGFPSRPDSVRVAVFDEAGKFWRGRYISLPFDPANQAPVEADIPDMLLEPRLDW